MAVLAIPALASEYQVSTASDVPDGERRRWVTATVALVIASLVSIVPAFMSIFLLDDPKVSPLREAFAYALLTLPLSCFLAASLPWMYRKRTTAWRLFMLPLLNGIALLLLLPVAGLFH